MAKSLVMLSAGIGSRVSVVDADYPLIQEKARAAWRRKKIFPEVGERQAARNRRQGIFNVKVNGFELIQRG